MTDDARKPLSFLSRANLGAQNALELYRVGRFAEADHAPFSVVHSDRVYALRHYGADTHRPRLKAPVLLVPPLMVTSEVYDIGSDVSAVRALLRLGIDVWMVDYGAPEEVEGGMDRTLDDHVNSVSDAIDRVIAATGKSVHLAGYSQGGMFVYQTAALRRSEGIASLITFGSPVDIYRNLPGVSDTVAGPVISNAARAIGDPLTKVAGIPGFLSSTAFKMLSPVKEVQQLADFVKNIHDRSALEKREGRRRFLGGEGFVAWPGPALRKFVDEFIVHNRMTSGGFVLNGQTVTLADINVPILSFVGLKDAIAQPASVRAIRDAAPNAEVFEVGVKAGHFGLVVGSRALRETWPTVVEWMFWQEGRGKRPERLPEDPHDLEGDSAPFDEIDFDIELFYEAIARNIGSAFSRAGETLQDAERWFDTARYHVPRIQRLRNLDADSRIGIGRTLSDQRREMPDATFFLWKGRAFTYADADRRVDNVVRGLISCGVRPGERVGVFMTGRPSYLSLVTAINRLGAVAVLLSPEQKRISPKKALEMVGVQYVVCDPESVDAARAEFDHCTIMVLGGGGEKRSMPSDVIDMEQIDPVAVLTPDWYRPNPGKATDLAMIVFTAGAGGVPRAARITNRRWAVSAIGAAATASLTPKDTVYCCLPLHHAAGMLVAVGGALVGGARLALGEDYAPDVFWGEVRRYGASVVFYAGEMVRELLAAAPSSTDNNVPVRLFAGSGMREHMWRSLSERFGGVRVLEFYASTEGNCVLANTLGKKVGSVGRPLPGSAEIALARYDFAKRELITTDDGKLVPCAAGQAGVLIARVDGAQPLSSFDGFVEKGATDRRLRKDAFEPGDTWFITRDVMRRDPDGDYWLVDRLVDVLPHGDDLLSSRSVEDAFYGWSSIERVSAYVATHKDERVMVAAVVPREGRVVNAKTLNGFAASLPPHLRPAFVRKVDEIGMTDGFRPLKSPLRNEGLGQKKGRLRLNAEGRYAAG